jgi:hypothetical protein
VPRVLSSSERLFPTLTPAQISRIAAHGHRRPMSWGAVLVNVAMAGAVFPGAAEDLSRANWPLSRAHICWKPARLEFLPWVTCGAET